MPAGPTRYHSAKWGANYFWSNGGWIIPEDLTILLACAKAAGWGSVRLSQGGLSTGVAASAMTHAGLGAGDIAIDGRSKAKVWALCAALLRSGIVAFPRGFTNDTFQRNKHIHWVSLENIDAAHPQAQAQIRDYRMSHQDGLYYHHRYTGPNPVGKFPWVDHWSNSPYNERNIKRYAKRAYYVNVDKGSSLLGLNVDRGVKLKRGRGERINSTRQVHRFGRWNVVTEFGTYYSLAYLSTSKPK